ncbi:MAG TPA: family 10 glycosylhydrolase [Gemmatimonadaceae bacterium]|jgi:uncharacterized lipoprotein YddW (UPF0748 family)|nr:family 10 glycosylhydrolase [Gemmatimonadaceae bacterium]
MRYPRFAAFLALFPVLSARTVPPNRCIDPIGLGHATLLRPPPIAREFRAAWISPINDGTHGDWPSMPGLSVDAQKAELQTLLDQAKAIGLNAVILHVRLAGDALYPTPYAPWSPYLTGTAGRDPGYDPLAYAVQEAHARGLQLHAWFNPFRATLSHFGGRASPEHVTRTHPGWIRRYGKQQWIDPGEPAARALVVATIADVVRRYDVDGVHIDDYFYPYRESETIKHRVHHHTVKITHDIVFPDDQTWERYGIRQGWTNRDDWRRHNIDTFVQEMYGAVKATKPWVLVGVSPFGIWRPGFPGGITGLDSYNEIYADSRSWLQKGWLDYLAPQLYWPLDGWEHRFVNLDGWWRLQNPLGRYVWPGLETAMERTGTWPATEIADQITRIRLLRAGTADIPGHVHFRMGSLTADGGLLGDELRHAVYTEPALVPAFPWLAHGAPSAPRVDVQAGDSLAGRRFLVTPGDTVSVAWWLVQRKAATGTWTMSLTRQTTAPLSIAVAPGTPRGGLTVRAIGRAGEESEIAWVDGGPPEQTPWFWADAGEPSMPCR